MTNRPNALVIGAGKAGTTSLHKYLDGHPRIFGARKKELMYFTAHYNKGAAWYLSNFPDNADADVFFESTPQYTHRDQFPRTAARIHDFAADMKLIFIVRDPISRIISHFNHWRRMYPDRYSDLETALSDSAERETFLARSKYHYQLTPYLDLFPPDQVHVVFLEDLKADFVPVLNDVFGFVGVAQTASEISGEIHNKGARIPGIDQRYGDDIAPAWVHELHTELAPDVRTFLEFCGKQPDFWGPGYT